MFTTASPKMICEGTRRVSIKLKRVSFYTQSSGSILNSEYQSFVAVKARVGHSMFISSSLINLVNCNQRVTQNGFLTWTQWKRLLDKGSVSPMKMRQMNLEFTDSNAQNDHCNEGSNAEDFTEGTLNG